MSALYFAYGSNLVLERVRQRVGAVQVIGVAQLRGFRLRLDKRGADGSGKANLHADAAHGVWGALYQLDAAAWPRLDASEPATSAWQCRSSAAARSTRPRPTARSC